MGTRAGRTGRPSGPPAAFLLLVLAVLTGLVAMHGLGPGGLPRPAGTETAPTGALHTRPEAARAGSGPMEATVAHPGHAAPGHGPAAHTAPRTDPSDADAHAGPAAHPRAASGRDGDTGAGAQHGGGGGGHAEHADPTCAASGTSGAPVLPPLAPAPGGVAAACAAAHAAPAGATASGRAPPSLSELQLLRI